MIVYVTGPDTNSELEAVGATLSLSGIDAHLMGDDMTVQEIYDEILGSDAVFMLFAGHESERVELAVELGIAIALGKPVYAVASSKYVIVPRRFMAMEGVRIFKSADEALEAALADLETADEQERETGIRELGELGGLGRDTGDGGDPEPVP